MFSSMQLPLKAVIEVVVVVAVVQVVVTDSDSEIIQSCI